MEKEKENSSLPIFFSKTCSPVFIFQPFLSRSSLASSKEYASVSLFGRAPNVPVGNGEKSSAPYPFSTSSIIFFRSTDRFKAWRISFLVKTLALFWFKKTPNILGRLRVLTLLLVFFFFYSWGVTALIVSTSPFW